MARRGRLWTSEVEVTALEEVSTAMRLDRPSPFGARILRAVDWPIAAPSTVSSTSVLSTMCCLGMVEMQEVERATVER